MCIKEQKVQICTAGVNIISTGGANLTFNTNYHKVTMLNHITKRQKPRNSIMRHFYCVGTLV